MNTHSVITGLVAIVAVAGASFTVSGAVSDGSEFAAVTHSPLTVVATSHRAEMMAVAMPDGKRSGQVPGSRMQ
jgi:Flp pilus assembly pilin Flp